MKLRTFIVLFILGLGTFLLIDRYLGEANILANAFNISAIFFTGLSCNSTITGNKVQLSSIVYLVISTGFELTYFLLTQLHLVNNADTLLPFIFCIIGLINFVAMIIIFSLGKRANQSRSK